MSGLVGYLNDPVKIISGADSASIKEWVFNNSGNIVLPQGGNILDNNGTNLLGLDTSVRKTTATIALGVPSIIWTGIESTVSSAKLFIQVEAEVTGDATGIHTQSCELIIASRSSQYEPSISVYGIVYTSVSQLVTFTTQRNGINNKIEIVGTTTGIVSSNALLRIYSTEQLTRD